MADDLPAGFKLDEPAPAAGGGDLPAGYKLDEPGGGSSREKELRAEYLKKLIAPGEPGYSARLKDSATLGLMRPISGVMQGIAGLGDPTSTFGERYRAGVGAEKDYADRAVANTPGVLGAATDVAGGVGGVGQAAAGAGRATLGKLIAQGAGTGAVEGAARNAEDPGKAAAGAATGATLGAGASAVVGGATKLIPGVQGAEKAARTAGQGTTPAELKAEAKPLFQALDMGGIAYGQPQTATLKAGIDDLIANNQYNKIAHSKISGYVDELLQKSQQPQGMGFNELHNLRSALATEARGPDAGTREAAGKVIGKIDELVLNNKPGINPTNRNVAEDYTKARELWKAASIADDVGYVAGKAERKAQSKLGVNPDEANRGAFRPLLEKAEKPGAYSPYSQEQRDLLAKIVGGDKLQNTYRNIGAAADSPITKAVVGLGTGAAGFMHGDPTFGLASGGAGRMGSELLGLGTKGLNRMAANRGAANIDELLRNITGSSPKAIPPEALRTLLAKQAAQRGGAAYAGSVTGEK